MKGEISPISNVEKERESAWVIFFRPSDGERAREREIGAWRMMTESEKIDREREERCIFFMSFFYFLGSQYWRLWNLWLYDIFVRTAQHSRSSPTFNSSVLSNCKYYCALKYIFVIFFIRTSQHFQSSSIFFTRRWRGGRWEKLGRRSLIDYWHLKRWQLKRWWRLKK